MPGTSRYIGSTSYQSIASWIICPQDAVGGRTPTPRNDSAASVPMLAGTASVAYTRIGAVMLGMISRKTMTPFSAPPTRAASTYSRCLTEIACPRTIRPMYGQPNPPITHTSRTIRSPSGMTEMRAIMKIRLGNDMSRSMVRLITASAQPPR